MKMMIYEDEDRDGDEDEKRTQSVLQMLNAIVIAEKILELRRITQNSI